MKSLEKIMDMAEREFDALSKTGEFRSEKDIEMTYKLMDIVKDALEIEEMEMGGYSSRNAYRGEYSRDNYSRENSRDGYSRENSRNSYRKRDSMGRYSRTGDMLSELHRMMEDASGEERAAIERCIAQIDK